MTNLVIISSVGPLRYNHSLLVENGLRDIFVLIEGSNISCELLCKIFDRIKCRSNAITEKMFLSTFKDGEESKQIYIIVKALAWVLSDDAELDPSLKDAMILCLGRMSTMFALVVPKKSESCWICDKSPALAAFRISGIRSFPDDAETWIVPTHTHDGEELKLTDTENLYTSDRAKKHKYCIRSSLPPKNERYYKVNSGEGNLLANVKDEYFVV
uniref:PV3 n=1 Tax=European wheat striate mosaic virus TaxID=2661631 RepID=A0A5P9K5S0_9VIRU|nr:pV3 [European wheat striate mosaic virus]